MGDERIDAAIGSLRTGVAALRELDRTSLDAVQLTELLRSVERVRRQLDAVDHQTLAEVEQRYEVIEILQKFLGIVGSRPESVRPRG